MLVRIIAEFKMQVQNLTTKDFSGWLAIQLFQYTTKLVSMSSGLPDNQNIKRSVGLRKSYSVYPARA